MKKAIVALLAGILCVSGFAACGEEETEANNQDTLNGEVTQEEWVSALDGLDLSSYTVDLTAEGNTDFFGEGFTINLVREGNKCEIYSCAFEENEALEQVKVEESTRYATKIDGKVYIYDKIRNSFNEENSYAWQDGYSQSYLFEDFSFIKIEARDDYGKTLPGIKTLSEIVKSAKSDMAAFTYDSEKRAYYTLSGERKLDSDTNTTYTVKVEISLLEGKIHLCQTLNLVGGVEGYMQECWSFENSTVDLPAQEELLLFVNGMADGV